MQTANKNIRYSVPVILMGCLGILSTATPGLALKVLFLFCGAGEIVLCFYGELIENKRMHKILICTNGIVFFHHFSLVYYFRRLFSRIWSKGANFFSARDS